MVHLANECIPSQPVPCDSHNFDIKKDVQMVWEIPFKDLKKISKVKKFEIFYFNKKTIEFQRKNPFLEISNHHNLRYKEKIFGK